MTMAMKMKMEMKMKTTTKTNDEDKEKKKKKKNVDDYIEISRLTTEIDSKCEKQKNFETDCGIQ